MDHFHLHSIESLKDSEISHLLNIASVFKKRLALKETIPLLKGKVVANLFYENSTRTRLSFEAAIKNLEGGVLNFASSGSSVQKGETLLDTAKNLKVLGPDAVVIRHSAAGTSYFLADHLNLPIINAGDGYHEHPTQALLDAHTLLHHFGSLKGINVLITGDIRYSRVAHSNIELLPRLGASVTLCGPQTLLPVKAPDLIEITHDFEKALRKADAVMMLRIQKERQTLSPIPSLREYSRFWGLNQKRCKLMKESAVILHPGPANWGVEIDPEVMERPNSLILDQVASGIVIRMAVIAKALAPVELNRWIEKEENLK